MSQDSELNEITEERRLNSLVKRVQAGQPLSPSSRKRRGKNPSGRGNLKEFIDAEEDELLELEERPLSQLLFPGKSSRSRYFEGLEFHLDLCLIKIHFLYC